MNSLVDKYRAKVPDDPRSDEELTLIFGKANDQDGRYNAYPDFVKDYKDLTAPPTLSLGETFGQSLKGGITGLKQSAVGLGALGADLIGATDARDYLVKQYKENQADAEEEGQGVVSRLEDINSVGSALRWGVGKLGELVPMGLEAALFAGAGAAIGSAIGPEGTGAGAVAGLGEGLFARQSARALLKAGIDKILGDGTVSAVNRSLVKSQLESIAEKKAIEGTLSPITEGLLKQQIKALAGKVGGNAANALNFYGIGAGSLYGDLSNREGVDNEHARDAALLGGVGSALAFAPLPAMVLAKYFPGVGEEVAQGFVTRLVTDAAKHIPTSTLGMGMNEVVNIAAEKYADPKRRDTPFDDADLSRVVNAAAVGAGAGAFGALLSAIPGRKAKPVFDPIFEKRHFGDMTDQRKNQLAALVTRDELGTLTEHDTALFATLSPEDHNFTVAFRNLPDTQRNKLVAEISKSKEVIPDGEVKNEGQGQGQDGLLSPDKTTAGTVESVPAVTEDQAKALKKLGYDDTDVSALDGKAAQDIIDTNTESWKKNRKNSLRASATSKPVQQSASDAALRKKIDEAGKSTKPDPTPEEIDNDTYQKGKVTVGKVEVEIETPKGELRQNKKGGEPWNVTLKHDYGRMPGTIGADGDAKDIYLGPNPASPHVWVIDQIDPETKNFDEHKSMYGFDTPEEALQAYRDGFSDGSGKKRIGGITEMTLDEFEKWRHDDKRAKDPLRYVKPKAEEDTATSAKPVKAEVKPEDPASIGLEPQKGKLGKQGYFKLKHEGIDSGSVRIDGETIHLINVRATEAGKGAGGAWLEKLKAFSDTTKRRIELIAKADAPELQPKLEKFYEEHGFTLADAEKRIYEYDKRSEVKPEVKPEVQDRKLGEVGELKGKMVKLVDPIHGTEIDFKAERADSYLKAQFDYLKALADCVGRAA